MVQEHEVKLISMDKIKADGNNPNIVTQKQLEAIKGSMEKFGNLSPIVVADQGNGTYLLADGEHRFKLYQQLGKIEIPAYVLQVTDSERRILRQVMNKLRGEHDIELDEAEFKVIENAGELDLLKKLLADEDKLLNKFMEKDLQDIEPENADEITTNIETGDIYQLGQHRIICADSTQIESYAQLLDVDAKVNLVVTSPPYWVGKDYEYQNNFEEVKEFIKKICHNLAKVTNKSNSRIVINTGNGLATAIDKNSPTETLLLLAYYVQYLREEGWLMRHNRIWIKTGGLPAPISPATDIIDQHCEFISTFYNPNGEKRGMQKVDEPWAQQGYWDFHGQMSTEGHSAAFPLELPARNIKLYSKENETVLDCFLGSGSTLIACEQLNRNCIGIELDPKFCQVIINRFIKLKGNSNEVFKIVNGEKISWQNLQKQ